MRQSTRLILNSGTTYARMVVTFGIGLLFTRLVLDGLGTESFGVWIVLTGLMFIVFSAYQPLVRATERFLAVGIGRGDPEALRSTFATVWAVFASVGFLSAAGGALLAQLLVSASGDLTPQQIGIASRALQLMVFGQFVLSLGAPFQGTLMAHQDIPRVAIMEVLYSAGRLGAAILAFVLPGEPLINLAGLIVAVNAGFALGFVFLATKRFPEARLRVSLVRRSLAREVITFLSWSIVTDLGIRIRDDAPKFLLFAVFGAISTGALGIAQQVGGYLWNFSNGVNRAIGPAISTAEGRNDRVLVGRLIQACNRYATLMMSMIMVPVLIDLDLVLGLWLGASIPPLTDQFVRLIMLAILIQTATNGYFLAISATGRIAKLSRIMVLSEIALLGAKIAAVTVLGFGPVAVPVVGLIGAGLVFSALVRHACHVLDLPFTGWLRGSVAPILASVLPGVGVCVLLRGALPAEWWRFVVLGICNGLTVVVVAWFVAVDRHEREHFLRVFRAGVGLMGIGRSGHASDPSGAGAPHDDPRQ